MSREHLQFPCPSGLGGTPGVGVRGFLRDMERAYRKGYKITEEDEERAVQCIRNAMKNGTIREQIAAVRTHIAMKLANLEEAKVDNQDQHASNQEQLAFMEILMQTPEGRELMAKMDRFLPGSRPSEDKVLPSNTPAVPGGDSCPPPARANEDEGGGGS